jgi:hypothetical protein
MGLSLSRSLMRMPSSRDSWLSLTDSWLHCDLKARASEVRCWVPIWLVAILHPELPPTATTLTAIR